MITPDPFVFDNNYKNTEQVRPYLADFMAIKDAIVAANRYPYNDSFKGQIAGLATTDGKNENTAIYLLQTLADLERLRERTQAFIDAGGYRLTERMPDPTERGTLVHTGFYMGERGWSETSVSTVKADEHGTVLFKAPRQKNWRTHHYGTKSYLFMPNANHA